MSNHAGREDRKEPRVTAIIQARMLSQRLPGKSLLELKGKPILYHVFERSRLIEFVNTVVLATSSAKENGPIIELARSMNIEVFSGSENNVLERYYLASEEFGGDYIVRITGDNPFTDVEYASMTVDIALEVKCDLCSPLNMPIGTAVEVIKKEALNEAYKMSTRAYHLEHVTPYIKERTELFSIEKPPVNIFNPFKNLRLTIDTPQDYEFAKILYDNIYQGSPFSIKEVIDFLKLHPDILSINSKIEQRSMYHSEIDDKK